MYNSFNHSGGEVHLNLDLEKIEHLNLDLEKIENRKLNLVRFDLTSSDRIMEMLMFCDAVKRVYIDLPRCFTAFIPYMPYSRADRVIGNGGGDAVGIKVIADILQYCGFQTVITLDPHSDVTTALIPNIVAVKPYKLIEKALNNRDPRVCSFIAPDSGAEKKVYDYCKKFGANFIRASKKRNPQTGEIKYIDILDNIPEHHFVYVIDDICDGGRTFVELAKHLSPDCLPELIVTHGIFSKGFKELFGYYEKIWTTDSFTSMPDIGETNLKLFTRMKCEELA